MSHSRAWIACLALVTAVTAGCDAKRRTTPAGANPAAGPAKDAEATALAELEARPDLEHCRTALQQLDNLESAAGRPVLSDAERADLAAFLRLTPAEATEVGQRTFSQTDAAYLEECLLVRAGVRSLRIDGRPPLERARLGFDWVCRMVYVDDRWPPPTNPWTTLQAGSGAALSRAYAVLAAWQQLGLDACLVGPPALKAAPSLALADSNDPTSGAKYAPARACGVKVGGDLFLFDPAAGQPLPAADGKSMLTLAQAKARPDALKGLGSADEVKTWQPFLAPTLSGLGRRMQWLEGLNPGGAGAKLFVDLAAQRARFAQDLPAVPTDAWSPETDPFSAPRVLARYAGEEASAKGRVALRDTHRVRMIPLEHIPRTNLAGQALAHLHASFGRPFEMLRYAPGSARDSLLRGQFRQALADLEPMKAAVDNARTRVEQDPNLRKDFERWADEFQRLSAHRIVTERDNPSLLPEADKALANFRNNARNRDVEQAFILGSAARPLGAEVTFLIAATVHERAERAQLDGSAQADWRNARDWWTRHLDASAQAGSPFPARDAHARALLARCQQFATK